MSYAYYHKETGESIFDRHGAPCVSVGGAKLALQKRLRRAYRHIGSRAESLEDYLKRAFEEWTLAEVVLIDRVNLAELEEKAAKYDALSR